MATISCSAQTTAANVVQKLMQLCGSPVSTSTGRVLRPKVGLLNVLAHSSLHKLAYFMLHRSQAGLHSRMAAHSLQLTNMWAA